MYKPTTYIDLTEDSRGGQHPVLFILPKGGSVVISFETREQAIGATKNAHATVHSAISAIQLYAKEK